MANNAELGLTIQKLICDKYALTPHPNAVGQFASGYNSKYEVQGKSIIDKIFNELNLIPIQCLTYAPSMTYGEKTSPHNFVMSDNSTLSIRTNLSGDKIAPRVVGQAGIEAFNEHFSEIIGKDIDKKEEIKKAVIEKIHLMLPVFIDYMFLSDYTVWIQAISECEFSYIIYDKNNFVDISFERSNFAFTRELEDWNESTTLKYKGKSLAEIQIHKNRTFKFRFIMNTLSDLLVEQQTTNETFGITAEKVICDIFGLVTPHEYRNRYSAPLSHKIRPTLVGAFKALPKAIKSTGAEKGTRGQNSKCPYDFILDGGKTLSLKTNTGKMICPPEVGQPGPQTCYLYFKDFLEGDQVTAESFKKMVFSHIADIMPIYVHHLFDSDYLLWVFQRGDHYEFRIYNSNFANNITWDPSKFEFTKNSLGEWNESNTVKYCGVSIGEFQVHKNRSCFKFRFNMDNFDVLIRTHSF